MRYIHIMYLFSLKKEGNLAMYNSINSTYTRYPEL